MDSIAPMLKQLGYDPKANPPNYGKADSFVQKNNQIVQQNEQQYAAKVKSLMGDQVILRFTALRNLCPGHVDNTFDYFSLFVLQAKLSGNLV